VVSPQNLGVLVTFAANVFRNLEGAWSMARQVLPQGGSMLGKASFRNDPDSLEPSYFYREVGEYAPGDGKVYNIYRDYIYRLSGDRISIFFAETPPRLFLDLEFKGERRAEAVHLCNCDRYRGVYDFAPDIFKLEMYVKGPQKDLVITTVFNRLMGEGHV
jgi:hypothetical protein